MDAKGACAMVVHAAWSLDDARWGNKLDYDQSNLHQILWRWWQKNRDGVWLQAGDTQWHHRLFVAGDFWRWHQHLSRYYGVSNLRLTNCPSACMHGWLVSLNYRSTTV